MTSFIDIHVHPPTSVLVDDGFRAYLDPDDLPAGPIDFGELADYYGERDGVAFVHAFDAGSALGSPALTNERLARSIAPFFDRLIGLGCVDPHRGEGGVVAAHDAHRMGLKGLFFHPPAQQFDPTGRRFAPLWDMAEELAIPVVVHCGTTAFGAGRRGGSRVRLDVADPLNMDRVASTRPDLDIVLAGVTPPWEEAAIAVATHKANVHLAPAGRPDRLGAAMRDAMTGPLSARVMMGSGFPFLAPDEWLEGWAALKPTDEVDAAVRSGNAKALFRL